METALKTTILLLVAWVAMVWPGMWTSLLILLSLSGICLGGALERHFSMTMAPAKRPAIREN